LGRIDFCTKEQYSQLLKLDPGIHKVIRVKNDISFRELKDLKQLIKISNYNLIIDAHNNLRSIYLRTFQNAKVLVYRKYSIRKFLLVKFKINLMKNLPPISERYRRIITGIKGLEFNDKPEPVVYTSIESETAVDNMIASLNLAVDTKMVCIAASSRHFTKTYPAEYYAEVINKFDKQKTAFFLTGIGKDSINIKKVKELTGSNVYDLCDNLETGDLAALMKRCSLLLSGDTGPMHIAEALNIPIVMMAGSSVKEFGFYPQNKGAVVIENNGLSCRPCSHIGRSSCPKVHFKCMLELTPEMVYNEAAAKLGL
jgi:heptosyltransferase-2